MSDPVQCSCGDTLRVEEEVLIHGMGGHSIVEVPKKTGAAMNRGSSRQDHETPWSLIRAVESKFGPLSVDLAASAANAKAPRFFTEADDSLAEDWSKESGLLWLNPPFANIRPWAKKCLESGSRIAFLVPASVGSNWYADFINKKAMAWFLNGRVDFIPGESYPKDCMVVMFGDPPGTDVWKWREQVVTEFPTIPCTDPATSGVGTARDNDQRSVKGGGSHGE